MLEINQDQIDAIRSSTELGDFVRKQLNNPLLVSKERELLTADEWAELEDVCHEVFRNQAPILKEISAEQSKGVYTISIHGIPGAYWVFAPEFDDEGVFSSLSEALAVVDSQHGEFLLDPESTMDSSIDDLLMEMSYDPLEPNFDDQLFHLIIESDDQEHLDEARERILGDSTLIRLANGSLPIEISARPRGLAAMLKKLDKSLGKIKNKYDGMARHPKIQKAEARARLYFIINRRLPDDGRLLDLYHLK